MPLFTTQDMESSSQVEETERILDISNDDEPMTEDPDYFHYKEFLRFNTDRPPLTSTQNNPVRPCNVYTTLNRSTSPSVLASTNNINKRPITNEDIFRLIVQTERNNKIIIERLTQEICALKENVKILKNEIASLKKENESSSACVLPSRPFSTEKEFNDFEDSLCGDSSKMESLKENFARLGGEDVQTFIKKNFKKIIDDEVAQLYSWKGTSTKRALHGTQVVFALKAACVSQIPNAKEEIMDKHIKRHFQYAKERLCKAKKNI